MNSSSTAKTILFWISIVFLGVMLWRLVSANTPDAHAKTLPATASSWPRWTGRRQGSDDVPLAQQLRDAGRIREAREQEVPRDGSKEDAPELTKALRDKAVQINVKEVRSGDWVLILLNAAAAAPAGRASGSS